MQHQSCGGRVSGETILGVLNTERLVCFSVLVLAMGASCLVWVGIYLLVGLVWTGVALLVALAVMVSLFTVSGQQEQGKYKLDPIPCEEK